MGDRKFAVLGAGLATVALTLAGCGGGGDDDPTPTPTITSGTVTTTEATTPEATADATTPEPSPSDPWALGPPAVTFAMQYDNEEGAIAFVEYYIQVVNYSFAKLDTGPLADISDINCVACQYLIDGIEQIEGDGLHREGGESAVDAILGVTYYPKDTLYIVDLTSSDLPATLLDSSGGVIQTSDAITSDASYVVAYEGAYDWRMVAHGAMEDAG